MARARCFHCWRRRPESSVCNRPRLSCVLLVTYRPLAVRTLPQQRLFLTLPAAQAIVKLRDTTDHSLDERVLAFLFAAASSRPSHSTAQLKCLSQGSVACASDLSLKRSQAISLQQ